MDLRKQIVTQTAIHVPQGEWDGQFTNPVGVAVDSYGNIYVADSINPRIQKFDSEGLSDNPVGEQRSTVNS